MKRKAARKETAIVSPGHELRQEKYHLLICACVKLNYCFQVGSFSVFSSFLRHSKMKYRGSESRDRKRGLGKGRTGHCPNARNAPALLKNFISASFENTRIQALRINSDRRFYFRRNRIVQKKLVQAKSNIFRYQINVIEARVNEKEKNNTTYLRMFRLLQVQVPLILTKHGFLNCYISKIYESHKKFVASGQENFAWDLHLRNC